MNRSPMLRVIVFRGIGALVPAIREAGIDIGDDFNSICHMCWTIFSDRRQVEAIENYFVELRRKAIKDAIRRLEAEPVAAAAGA